MRIDWWTLALQTINVLVLVWILARFFFRPVADIVAKRQEEANKLLSDAGEAREKAADAQAEADKMRSGITTERDRLIAEAQKAARIEQKNLMAQVSQDIAKLRDEAKLAIARDREAAEQAIIARASELAVDIAERLVARLPPGVSLAAFLDGLCQKLRALPLEEKRNFTSQTADHPIEIVTATALSNAEIEQIRNALREALGLELRFKVSSDPSLIAGIELHGTGTIVRNSWLADLDQIREELTRAQRPSRP
jgi:F-type H+-transporting ATPase subunit b